MEGERLGQRGKRLPGRPKLRSPDEAGNRTIAVGLTVLQTVARMPHPPTLSEVAHSLGMPPARAARYLASLAQCEFLNLDHQTGRYSVGTAVMELGMIAMTRIDRIRLALDLMKPLTDLTGLVSILYVWGSNGPTAIKWEQGTQFVPIRLREGLNISVVATAAGRVFLAYHDPQQVKPILQKDLKSWNASAAPERRFSMKDVESIREEVLEIGMAQTIGVSNSSIAALAAPVFAADGLVMVLTIVGVVGSFDASPHGEPARALRETTDRLSGMLGAGGVGAVGRSRTRPKHGKPPADGR